jgi:hypothetical protein
MIQTCHVLTSEKEGEVRLSAGKWITKKVNSWDPMEQTQRNA